MQQSTRLHEQRANHQCRTLENIKLDHYRKSTPKTHGEQDQPSIPILLVLPGDQCASNGCSNETRNGDETIECSDSRTETPVRRHLAYDGGRQRVDVADGESVEACEDNEHWQRAAERPHKETQKAG